jgi:hypothetical protein
VLSGIAIKNKNPSIKAKNALFFAMRSRLKQEFESIRTHPESLQVIDLQGFLESATCSYIGLTAQQSLIILCREHGLDSEDFHKLESLEDQTLLYQKPPQNVRL